jgi:hypothetical protein
MGMKHYFVALVSTLIAVVAVFIACTVVVDLANSKETTTLDEALERPVKVQKFEDKENGVVCYYVGRYPDYLNCVKVEDDTRD